VAQVILKEIRKSFPARRGEQSPALAAVDPALAASPSLPQKAPAPRPQQTRVLQDINLTIADGEFMVLVGPSGCGKSTLLRLIAGLEDPSSGQIWVGDHCVNHLPPKARDIAMVFQSYALYPHMTVYDNLAFGLRRTGSTAQGLAGPLENLTRALPKPLRRRSKREQQIQSQVQQVAQMLELETFLQRYPKELSGGQKQRVALGRAMARNPQVFLMDEPLSNLDAKLRAQTRAQIVQLQRQLGTTTIYVTHDQTEAMTMGDRIAVLNAGEIQQLAPPLELYQQPANRFVAEFIGSPPMNFLDVTVQSPTQLVHPAFTLTLDPAWANTLAPYQGQFLTLGVRPEHLDVTADEQGLPVQVVLVEALGHETYLSCVLDAPSGRSVHLQARIEPHHRVKNSDHLQLRINSRQIHLFEADSGLALFPQSL
jgi:multiple sugar transport system ATP-binding protein